MSDKSKYRVIALVGPAGCGKDTILKEVLKISNDFNKVISYTSRPKRDNEEEGKDYYYVDTSDFITMFTNNTIVELAEFNNWFYGTNLPCYRKDKINIGIYDPTRLEILLSNTNMEVTAIYIETLDKLRLIRQLQRETEPDIEEIYRRYVHDKADFSDISDLISQVLANDTIEDLQANIQYIAGLGASWAET